ncbi:MAG: hypothetical protein ACRYG6_03980 [Janthinobacterium lividum]
MTRRSLAASPARVWPADLAGRRQAQALLRMLDADLLSHDSATLTLERWCAAHDPASPAFVVADRVRHAESAPDPRIRVLLAVSDAEPVRHRRVRLRCGAVVLSEAENWYVPSRLTPGMNAALDASDASFGHVVAPLGFRRQTISAETLWHPVPDGWPDLAAAPGGTMPVPPVVLRHHAVLHLLDGTPFSVVRESYTDGVLAFPGRPVP